MYKFFRIFEGFQKFFKKSILGAERRISLTPIVNHMLDEEDYFLNRDPHIRAYIQIHQKYQKDVHNQIQQSKEKGAYQQSYNFGCGLTDLLAPHKLLLKQKLVFYTGDYQVNGEKNFVHTIQLGRTGAENYFWSIDEVETVQSKFIDFDDYQMEDSFLLQRQ